MANQVATGNTSRYQAQMAKILSTSLPRFEVQRSVHRDTFL